jgi:hypothetical protein
MLLRVLGRSRDASRNVGGGLGDGEAWHLAACLAPGGFGDAEVLQHPFRAQPPRGDADRGDRVVGELGSGRPARPRHLITEPGMGYRFQP